MLGSTGEAEIQESYISDAARAAGKALLDPVELARTRALPGFPAYQRRAVNIWRAPKDEDPILATSLRDLGRFVCGLWALYLHSTPGGITLTRLSELLTETGISGAGRARSMLIFMRFIGYVEPTPGSGDGRIKNFRPTARMTHAFRDRYRRELAAAAPVNDGIAEAMRRIDDDTFFGALMTAVSELTLAAFQQFEPQSVSLNSISHRFAGMMVLSELLALGDREDRPFPPTGPISYSLARVAKACSISRTQVRRVLQAGADDEFFELRGEGELVLTPLLAEHVTLLVASTLMMLQWSCARALATADGPST